MPISWVGLKGMSPYSVRPQVKKTADSAVATTETASSVRDVTDDPDGGRKRRLQQVRAYAEERKKEPGVGALVAARVMSAPVVTVHAETLLSEARKLLDQRGFRNLPVLSAEKTLVGMLHDRELLRWHANDEDDTQLQIVSDLMSTQLLTATIDTPLRTIAKVMVDEQLSSIPIINSAQRVVGILTMSDVMRCVVEHSLVDLWA